MHTRLLFAQLAGVAALALCVHVARAADESFVGVLALAVDPEVAAELGLNDGQREQLAQLIADREDEALELALSLRRLDAAQQAEKLKPFVSRSEQLGMRLLTPEQRKKLLQKRIAKDGMSKVLDGAVGRSLNLTDKQRTQVEKLLSKRKSDLAQGGESERSVTRAKYERMIADVLTAEQRRGWEQLAGLAPEDSASQLSSVASEIDRDRAAVLKTQGEKQRSGKPFDEKIKQPNRGGNSLAETPGKVRIDCQFMPWDEMLELLAEQAGYSLMMESAPPGTFNYRSRREMTLGEAMDVLNHVLETKGYTLIRRDELLFVVNLEDDIPPNMISDVTPDELEDRGEYELVRCLFTINRWDANEARQQLESIAGKQATLEPIPAAKQILITATAGRLRQIRSVIAAVEQPEAEKKTELVSIELEHLSTDEALPAIRRLLGIAEETDQTEDGSLTLGTDIAGRRLLLSGQPERIQKVREILKIVDVATGLEDLGTFESPQLEVYSVPRSDPSSVLSVMQTILSDTGAKLEVDSKTGNLIALARPAQQATIRATLSQLERDGREIEVFWLKRVDPQTAILSINRLFGVPEGEEAAASDVPRVEADLNTGQLIVRGTAAQIGDIRKMLEKMGETLDTSATAASDDGNVRILNVTGRTARNALDQVKLVWPTMRPNTIRTFSPGSRINRLNKANERPPAQDEDAGDDSVPQTEGQAVVPIEDHPGFSAEKFIAKQQPDNRASLRYISTESRSDTSSPAATRLALTSDIIVSPGPNGTLIASDDIEALNEFQQLFLSLADRAAAAGPELTIAYLTHTRAVPTAELLNAILGISESGDGGGGGLIGSLASNALGDAGGDLVGAMLGIGGGPSLAPSGSVRITPDARLNMLVIDSNEDDLATIRMLLEKIDVPNSPEEVETINKARMIYVEHSPASEIADVVRQVYAKHIASAGGQPRQPSPEEFMKMLRGGKSNQRQQESVEQMTLTVDTRSNAIVVSAPDTLFKNVQLLVTQLDKAGLDQQETMQVVQLRRANAEVVQNALVSIVGEKVITETVNNPTNPTKPQPARNGSRGGNGGGEDAARRARQQFEFIQAIQKAAAARGKAAGGVKPGRKSRN